MLPPNSAPCNVFRESARLARNSIDAATQPPTGTRERILNLCHPRTDHRYLGFEDSCLSGAATSFSCRFGQVADDGGNRFRFRHACGWMAHSQVRQSEHRDWVDVGVWRRTALDCRIQYGPNAVGRSSFLWGDGGFDGRSDEYSRRNAREAIPTSHHVLIPCPLQFGWNGRIGSWGDWLLHVVFRPGFTFGSAV
jgi:hypothetical protein